MSLLIETIKITNNQIRNIKFHTERVNYSRRILLNSNDTLDLAELIIVPILDPEKKYMCRVLYSQKIENVEFIEYFPRKIKKLFLVTANDLDYSFKYADREELNKLKTITTSDPNSDILIIQNGLITDTSFSNIVFFNGRDWLTPTTPLLKGTKREYYLHKHLIKESQITVDDLNKFSKVRLINAMLDLEDGNDIIEIIGGG